MRTLRWHPPLRTRAPRVTSLEPYAHVCDWLARVEALQRFVTMQRSVAGQSL